MNLLSSTSLRTLAFLVLLVLIAMPLWATRVSSQEPEEKTPAESAAEEEVVAALALPSAPIFSYQGQLLDTSGNPISNAAMPMTFHLYTTATGGSACWTEDHTGGNAVNVSDGLFHVLLGQITAIDSACLTNDAYLELVVNNETLSPRELLTSVAHAVEATSLADGDLAVTGDISSTGEIYEEYKSVAYSDNDARWFRFAQSPENGKENSGIFEIRWARAAQYGHVRFAIGADYGRDEGVGITILDSSAYIGGLSKIRLLMNDTFEQMYVEAYNEGGGGSGYTIIYQVYKYSGRGWSLIDITDGSIPADYESYEMPTNIVFGARSDNDDIFVFNRDGNVGIGTTSPSEKLHVNGSVRGNQNGALRISTGNGYVDVGPKNSSWAHFETNKSSFYFNKALGVNSGVFASYSGNHLYLKTDSTTRIFANKDTGNVGIGTTSPQDKLEVNGDIRIPSNRNGINNGNGRKILETGWTESLGDFTAINTGWDWEAAYEPMSVVAGGTAIFFMRGNSTTHAPYDTTLMKIQDNGNVEISGNLSVSGTCSLASTSGNSGEEVAYTDDACEAGSITSGAYIEANLQTPEERQAERIEGFTRGDLLCWQASAQKLELCSSANDRLVMAVADSNGKPIVIGAEPMKVIGPVKAGDILVASNVPGYAMVNNDPKPGTVMAQALEDFDGEKGLIKAMIRKW